VATNHPREEGGNMNTKTTALATTNRKNVYILETHEPWATRIGAMFESPTLYASREEAEKAAADYNETFNDEELATVRELEVEGQSHENPVDTA
jgi:hypothetical protein